MDCISQRFYVGQVLCDTWISLLSVAGAESGFIVELRRPCMLLAIEVPLRGVIMSFWPSGSCSWYCGRYQLVARSIFAWHRLWLYNRFQFVWGATIWRIASYIDVRRLSHGMLSVIRQASINIIKNAGISGLLIIIFQELVSAAAIEVKWVRNLSRNACSRSFSTARIQYD